MWARATLTNEYRGFHRESHGQIIAVSHTAEEVSAASMTLPTRKVVNRRLCCILILLYVSWDFKAKISLNASGNRANRNKFHLEKNATIIMHQLKTLHETRDAAASWSQAHLYVKYISNNGFFPWAFLYFTAPYKHSDDDCYPHQHSCLDRFTHTEENGSKSRVLLLLLLKRNYLLLPQINIFK